MSDSFDIFVKFHLTYNLGCHACFYLVSNCDPERCWICGACPASRIHVHWTNLRQASGYTYSPTGSTSITGIFD